MSFQEIGKPGFRYKVDFERPAEEIIRSYRTVMEKTGCLTGNVGDCLGRGAAMNSCIGSLASGMKVVGPALTVKVPPCDNLMIHKAMTLIKPGDVLVVDGGGNHSWALMGFLMISTAIKIGVAGIVIDGCVRDAQEIRKSGFPVFSAGLSPNGPFKEGPGEINYPVNCGGLIVNPGDIIVADDDGVVVLKKEYAAATIAEVNKVIEREEKRLDEIASGMVIRPGIDEILAKKGIL
ncbi:MAG: RraA family protein [Deltaproteobacteria bacterium]|nr:RraA family protein [Deltaproteobacteria bacterium]